MPCNLWLDLLPSAEVVVPSSSSVPEAGTQLSNQSHQPARTRIVECCCCGHHPRTHQMRRYSPQPAAVHTRQHMSTPGRGLASIRQNRPQRSQRKQPRAGGFDRHGEKAVSARGEAVSARGDAVGARREVFGARRCAVGARRARGGFYLVSILHTTDPSDTRLVSSNRAHFGPTKEPLTVL
jgi:hypothetical protein